MDNDQIEEIASTQLSPRDQYYYEQSYKEPVERIGRIEEAAKFLAGATATTSGFFLAAFKLSLGDQTVREFLWFLPYLLWAFSLIFFVLVLLPLKYGTRENDPDSWREAYKASGKWKYRCLVIGAVLFILGIFSGALPFWLGPGKTPMP